jgi:hypothetical protein
MTENEKQKAVNTLFVLGMLVATVGVIVVLMMGGCGDRPRQVANDDPYPHCAVVRNYLKREYGDYQIISWGKRTVTHGQRGDNANLNVHFRAGDKPKSGVFIIGPGDVIESAQISD